MIPTTPEIARAISDRKAAYWSARGVKVKKTALVYVCAHCGHRGGTLIVENDFRVCGDAAACKSRKLKLSANDAAFLEQARGQEAR